jgi:hypothetical protein
MAGIMKRKGCTLRNGRYINTKPMDGAGLSEGAQGTASLNDHETGDSMNASLVNSAASTMGHGQNAMNVATQSGYGWHSMMLQHTELRLCNERIYNKAGTTYSTSGPTGVTYG